MLRSFDLGHNNMPLVFNPGHNIDHLKRLRVYMFSMYQLINIVLKLRRKHDGTVLLN